MEEFRAWERMPSMVPYMPWMAMPMTPEQAAAYYPQMGSSPVPLAPEATQITQDDEEEVIAVAIPDSPPARPAVPVRSGPTGSQRLGTKSSHLGSQSSRLGRQTGSLQHTSSPASASSSKKKLFIGLATAAGIGLVAFVFLGKKSGSSALEGLTSAVSGPAKVSFELPQIG
jgi:hypothetical protein